MLKTPKMKKIIKLAKLRFINSYKFLNTSLDKLTSFLDKDKFRILQRKFCNLLAENFNLLIWKVIFRVHWLRWKVEGNVFITVWIFLQFVDRQNRPNLRTINVWQRFSIRTLGEHSDLYMTSCCWPIFLKTFVIVASWVMDMIPRITILYLVSRGKRC